MARKRIPPFETEITSLGKGGTGLGEAPDGRPVQVRLAPPGSRVLVLPQGLRKGVWQGKRLEMIRPPSPGQAPPCAVFGLCGGCSLQELPLAAQRDARHGHAVRSMEALGAMAGPPVIASPEWAYRNKVELSWGTARFLSEEAHAAGQPIDGRFLGFHSPGRWDRVVDLDRCELVPDAMNAVIALARAHSLAEDAPLPWNPRTHQGFWRHLSIRRADATGEVLVTIDTGEGPAEAVAPLAEALLALALPGGGRVVGVRWLLNTGVADVARGEELRLWGRGYVEEHLGPVRFHLSGEAFFQSSTQGAVALYDTIASALGPVRGHLLDLYSGIGSIGLYLADRFDAITGVEEVAAAVEDARANAALNGVPATFLLGKVEEQLQVLDGTAQAIVVDPPRAGLHPKVARALAQVRAEVLIYVACNPASLARDAPLLAEGGWRADGVWTVDLFPQTGHMEAVARFVRE